MGFVGGAVGARTARWRKARHEEDHTERLIREIVLGRPADGPIRGTPGLDSRVPALEEAVLEHSQRLASIDNKLAVVLRRTVELEPDGRNSLVHSVNAILDHLGISRDK